MAFAAPEQQRWSSSRPCSGVSVIDIDTDDETVIKGNLIGIAEALVGA